jgi:FkbM family methyltransferase
MAAKAVLATKVFLEIGTCDFDTCLPLAKEGWSGFMIEGDPKYAKIMKSRSADYDVVVSNIALTDYDGFVKFHTTLDGTGWIKGIGTVAANNHLGERLLDQPDLRQFIEDTITVPCSTLDTFLTESHIDHLDFMKIDTEGHEMNILGTYSWRVKPTMIKVEHSHIDDKKMCNLLRSHGYMVWTEAQDIYGVV